MTWRRVQLPQRLSMQLHAPCPFIASLITRFDLNWLCHALHSCKPYTPASLLHQVTQ